MIKRLLLLALLFSPIAFAEIVDPTADDNSVDWQNDTGTQCDSADCTVHIEDDDTATAICDDTGASGTHSMTLTMDSPTANPTTTASDQTVQGSVSRHDDANNGTNCDYVAAGNSPTFNVNIFCGGSATGLNPVSGFLVTDSASVSFSGTFTYPATSQCTASGVPWSCCTGSGTGTCCADDGSDLEFEIQSTRSGGSTTLRRWVGVEELEWDASVSGGVRKLLVVN